VTGRPAASGAAAASPGGVTPSPPPKLQHVVCVSFDAVVDGKPQTLNPKP
jgi:hypothetical protein